MGSADRTVDDFLASIASERASPAGGSAAAVVGATGAALCEMVCLHTTEYDGVAEGTERLTGLLEARANARQVRDHLLDLADADAAAVDELVAALPGPVDGAVEKRATGVPLAIAEACLSVLEGAGVAAEQGSDRAAPDAVTGALLAHAALRAAVFTVRTNLASLDDGPFVEQVTRRCDELEDAGERAFERAWRTVEV